MAEPTHNYTRLPGKLRNELGISKTEYDGARRSHNGPRRRKEQRKATRVENKTKHVPLKKRRVLLKQFPAKNPEKMVPIVRVEQRPTKVASMPPRAPKSILKAPKVKPILSPRQSPPPKIARRIKDELAEDDAEIAGLQKALGVKDKSKLPKSFEEDGLDDLLEGLDDDVDGLEALLDKRKRSEGNTWLKNKRRKAQGVVEEVEISSSEENLGREDGEDEMDPSGEVEANEENDESIQSELKDEEEIFDGLSDDDHQDENEIEDESEAEPTEATRLPRENPYVAPVTASTEAAIRKYVPPSLRMKDPNQTEDLSRLRKQVQGLLNRLSEANMLSIIGDVEKLYQNNPRQHVSATVLDVLLGLLSDPSSLQDTFIILHAGFIAALYKKVGTEFGAQAIQRIDEEFSQHYEKHSDGIVVDKRLVNLTNLFAELYNFQVIGSVFIYDLIRLFLNELSETNTELLLKIIRNAGSQLRQDDPFSLRAIVQLLQDQIRKAGEENVSTKIKFMLETMNNLRNNRMKTGVAASTILSEHTIHMKRTLGMLNQKQMKASEPLRISLQDIRESERRGKWWLLGANYRHDGQDAVIQEAQITKDRHDDTDVTSFERDEVGDLIQLAKEQRMNTSIRQSIFIAVMSATDHNDAYLRLMKLRLKKSQELEIPKVLIHCSGAEKVYNPFYTLLARRICSDRRLKMAFQFSLWDLFKRMGGDEEFGDEVEDGEGKLGLRAVVNLARMFGSLIADGGLGLGVLKNLSLAYLQPETQIFVEILLITTILQSQKVAEGARNEAAIIDIFLKPKEMTEMARGLQNFLKKNVSKSDVASSKQDKETIKWGCRVASSALTELTSKTLFDA